MREGEASPTAPRGGSINGEAANGTPWSVAEELRDDAMCRTMLDSFARAKLRARARRHAGMGETHAREGETYATAPRSGSTNGEAEGDGIP